MSALKRKKQSVTINALPTKEFFVDTITKDLSLIDAICDLVDNCVDAAYRKATNKANYNGLSVSIDFNTEEFKIVDNCGGIPPEIAQDFAFRMGRPKAGVQAPTSQIGQFGIGMKRAVFKIGRVIDVESRTANFHFRLPINVDAFVEGPSDDWTLQPSIWDTKHRPREGEATGVTIIVGRLNTDARNEFATAAFATELLERISEKHRQVIQKGFKITVNSRPCHGKPFTMLFSPDAVVPARHQEHLNGKLPRLDIEILAGIGPSMPKQAGWYVSCNGRFILEADQSATTGWGRIGESITLPKMHHQFSRFRGFVFFNSDDPSRIPWNTTKTGIDPENAVFKRVREQMVLVTREVIDFLNQLDAENDRDEKPLKDTLEVAQEIPLPEIQAKLGERSDFRVSPAAGALQLDRLIRISYQKPLREILKVREKLGIESNREIGEKTFEYFFKYECAKKKP